jgi:spermidine synthase
MPLWAAYIVVFVASCCTLILELVAGRILAPYVGVSLYTWTSIIGVVLAGISVGNYLGGRAADRWPERRTLGVLLAAGGIASLAILPLIHVATAIPTGVWVQATDRLGGGLPIDRALILISRIVAITTIIFFPPSFLLGMVSPVVVKLVLRDFSRTGGVVGKIYAFSTLGAIVGTFATGFVLVQVLGTRRIVLGVGLVLLLMAVLFGDLVRVRRAAAGTLGAGALLTGLLVPAQHVSTYQCFDNGIGASGECLGRSLRDGWHQALDSGCLRETSYYCIKIHDHVVSSEEVLKTLVLDHLVHSYNSLEDPSYLHYAYIKVYAEVADYLAQRLPNQDLQVLYIGGGGYTLPRHIEATYPNARQEVIEIDPGVTQTTYEKLGVDPNRTSIITYNLDGRLMLNQLAERRADQYDLIIGDAFNDLSIPYHLTTREFDLTLKGLLKDDGYYLALVIDKLRGGKFITAYTETARQVWPNVYILADGQVWESSAASTYVVAASNHPLDFARLQQARGQGPDGRPVTRVMPPELMEQWLAEARAPVLTDDYAPVDNLIAPVFAERGF